MRDEALVKGILRNEMLSLDALIKKYGNLIYHVVSSVLVETHYAQSVDECVNDVYLGVWNHMDTYRGDKSSLKNWLCNVAKHKAIDYKRKLSTRYANEAYGIEEMNLPFKEKVEDALDYENDFLLLLEGLKEQDRVILTKRYLNGDEIDDIAKDMSLTSNTVYKRLQRSRDKIKERLKKECVSYD